MTDYAPLLAQLHAHQSEVTLGKNHIYRDRGGYRVGVTTALKVLNKEQLNKWSVRVQVAATARAAYLNPPMPNEPIEGYEARMARMGAEQYEHERVADEAAELGAEIHALIEKRVKDMLGLPCPEPFVSVAARRAFEPWEAWAVAVGFKPLAAEIRVSNRAEGYCGTVDALALINGRLVVADWKPSAILFPERKLQLIAYVRALESMGWPAAAGMVVSLPRDGRPMQMVPGWLDDVEREETWAAFRACVLLHGWLGAQKREDARKERVIASAEKFMEKNG